MRINRNEKLIVGISKLGRIYPIKIWDDDYFNQMANSKFVLCPNGDYIWTYRFFEAVICGAIPIVESTASIYQGFNFFNMNDPFEHYKYDPDLALQNYLYAKQLLTIPKKELNNEIKRILNQRNIFTN